MGNNLGEIKKSRLKRLLDADERLIRRYFFFIAQKNSTYVGRSIARGKIKKDISKYEKLLTDAHASLIDAYKSAERLGLGHSMTILGAGIYIVNIQRDIQAIKLDMLTSQDLWKRKLMARIMLLFIYEFDMDKVTGKNFREAANFFSVDPKVKKSLTKNKQELREALQSFRDDFSYERNNILAHRTADAMKQYRYIRNINEREIAERAGMFFRRLDCLLVDIIEVTRSGSGLKNAVNQLLDKKI